MKKRKLTAALLLFLLFVCMIPLPTAAQPVEADSISGKGTTAAPPGYLYVSIQVGDSDRLPLTEFSSSKLLAWARMSNTSRHRLKYSSASYSGSAGRVVTDYIPLTDLLSDIGRELMIPVTYGTGDYLVMGEDFTKDQELIDAGYSREDLTGNWYSYDEMIGTDRYYFPYWNQGNSSQAVKVPAVLGIRSYGGSSGITDTVLDAYAASADYLWAYVVYFGQKTIDDLTYPYFYYGQDELTLEYPQDGAVNATILALLKQETETAGVLLEDTVVASGADQVAQGTYWVTQKEYKALQQACEDALQAQTETEVSNRQGFDALTGLIDAQKTFAANRKAGQKSGYFWYTEHKDGTPYVIATKDQLWELSLLVNGKAYDETSLVYFDADSFAGQTLLLDGDLDADGTRPCIGTAAHPFNGTFDGQGYTISGLSISGLKDVVYTGLFGYLGSSAVIKDLSVEGNVYTDAAYAGGIAASSEGRIENCRSFIRLQNTNTMNGCAGGIVGRNQGEVKNCLSNVTLTGAANAGLIAGKNEGLVTGCLGGGTITSSSAGSGLIARNAGTAAQCIAVSGTLCTANTGTYQNSYTLGETTGVSGGTYNALFCSDGQTDLRSAEVFSALTGGQDGAEESGTSFVMLPGSYPALSWQKVCTLSFQSGLQDLFVEPVQTAEYLPFFLPADPTADDSCLFACWYTDVQRTEVFDAAQTLTGDQTLYAGWIPSGEETIDYGSGDLDRNGVTDAKDAVLLQRFLAGKAPLTSCAQLQGDRNKDGQLDSKDVTAILLTGIGRILQE